MCTIRQGSLLFLLFSLVLTSPLFSQEAKEYRDSLTNYILGQYGSDQELYRGYQFYNTYFQYKGDPYFPVNTFNPGSMVCKGITYPGVSLKYDCYAQLLVLEYSDFKGRYNQLSLNADYIDSFVLSDWTFQKLSLDGREAAFYQLIREGPLYCYIHWSRSAVAMDRYDKRYLYEFSRPSGEFLIAYQGQIHPFSGKKNFVSVFPESLSPAIRKYLRETRFSFRNALPGDIENLLVYVGTQLTSLAAE